MTSTSPPRKQKTYARNLGNGLTLQAEVSPCVFMYPSYPLQIQVTMYRHADECLGQAFAVDRTKTAETYSDATVHRLLARIRTVSCRRCSTPAFDPDTVRTNRGGFCEKCFLSDLQTECAAALKAEQRKIASRDRRMKRRGMTVRVTAWVHPQSGGDDYQVDWYLASSPTPEEVSQMVRDQGSCQLDDYQIVVL
jgi:hypothetical protein